MRTLEEVEIALGDAASRGWRADGRSDRARSDTLTSAIDLLNSGDFAGARQLLVHDVRYHDPDNAAAWALMACMATTHFGKTYCLNQLLRIRPGFPWAANELRELLASTATTDPRNTSEPVPQTDLPLPPRFRSEPFPPGPYEAIRFQPAAGGLSRTLHGAISAALALILAASTVLLLGPRILGSSLLVVLSQSMEPAIPMGAVVISQPVPASDVSEGDVITYRSDEAFGGEGLITHRVIGVDDRGAEVLFETKGDASDEPDIDLVPASVVLGRVWFAVPLAGFALAFVRTPLGFAVIVGMPASFIIAGEVKAVLGFLRDGGASGLHEGANRLSGAYP